MTCFPTSRRSLAALLLSSALVLGAVVSSSNAQQQQEELPLPSSALRGGAAVTTASSAVDPSLDSLEFASELHELDTWTGPEDEALEQFELSEDASSGLIPATYAEYRYKQGEYEVHVHRMPVQTLENGEEMDPWMQLALAEGIDLNDYNVTYEDGTWETLEEDHRRNLISINSWENNNARFCMYARRSRGLSGLNWRSDLIQQAQKQAAYMASIQRIQHRSYLATGINPGWQIICENVCQNVNIGYGGAFTALMNDLGHRQNILNARVRNIGVGVRRNGAYYYMCQLFLG